MYQAYAGLIFDMDGTLFNSEPMHRKAWRTLLTGYGLRFDEQAMNQFNGAPTWRIAQHIIQDNQADLDPHRLAQEKKAMLKNLELPDLPLLPAADIAKSWYKRRPLAVGTGSDSDVAAMLLEKAGLSRYFTAVVCADQVRQHKPAPETFLRCAALMQVEPQRCIVFEDAEFGFTAARQAGMDVVDVRTLFNDMT